MGLLKSHRSFFDILRSSSGDSHDKAQSQTKSALSEQHYPNHRSCFRSRISRVSITPQSSSCSLAGATSGGSEDASGDESLLSSPTTDKKEHKHKEKCWLRHLRRSDSHHSLRRFFKILQSKEQPDHASTLPLRKEVELSSLPLSKALRVSQKYSMGRLIGSGASGLVNLVSALSAPEKIYALKKFRPKLANEVDHNYITKVKNEFLVGEYLRHQNLIHTIELICEDLDATQAPEFFIIMEYCSHDFFTLVMSGLMRKAEIFCYLKQIINGTNYLHISGIAHRDLKLDNCVVDQNGILKLIDFGSAFQFRKPSEHSGGAGKDDLFLEDGHKLVLARGIVGSDPYLAPEVFQPVSPLGYDARLADVWSIAIIYCCMVLKRFPWKVPNDLDVSFRFYCETPAPEFPMDDFEHLTMKAKSTGPKGAERLLNLLPTASHPLIKGMLTVDTRKRFQLKDVVASEFYKSIDHCHYFEPGKGDPQAEVWDPSSYAIAVAKPIHSKEKHETAAPTVSATGAALETASETGSGSTETGPGTSTESSETGPGIVHHSRHEPAPETKQPRTKEQLETEEQPVTEEQQGIPKQPKSREQPAQEPTNSEVQSITCTDETPSEFLKPRLPPIGTLIKGRSHRHHLVTEEEVERMHAKRGRHSRDAQRKS